jgi:hypothetical protein
MARSSPRDPRPDRGSIRRRVRKPSPPVVSMSAKSRDRLRSALGFFLLVVFGLFCWWSHWWFFTGSWNALRKHVPEYVDLTNANPQAPPSPVKKIVIVDVRARDLDPLHYDLTRSLRAERPEEVTTIAQVRRTSTLAGVYSGGGAATKWTFEVQVVDRASKRILETRSFVGGDPAYSVLVRRGDTATSEGDKPISQVLDYLVDLAKRTQGP